MTEKFWMVYAENGQAPTVKHPSNSSAIAEAERLALKTGQPVYLLEALEVCKPKGIQWEPCRIGGEYLPGANQP